MNILVVTVSYPPEIRSASHLMQELAEGLCARGHRVTVVTCYPRYNLSEGSPGVFPRYEIQNGVEIVRAATLPWNKVNFIIRGIAQITMPYFFQAELKKKSERKFDAVIVYSPPLPLALLGTFIKKKYKARYILNIQDIFPQNAIDLGILRNPLLVNFFQSIESRSYRQADVIAVHSGGNRNYLVKNRNVPQNKVQVLHNWIDLESYDKVKINGSFRKKFGLEGKFIFLFGGVIGPSQNLDLVVDIAAKVRSKREIVFLLVGDGSEKERLDRLIKDKLLQNVVIKPFVSKEEYPTLVKEADVGLVCLSPKNKTPVVPSKILGYMAAGVPVLAFLNRESDGHQIIHEARCGYSDVSDDVQRAAQMIKRMYEERNGLKEMGLNGYRYAVRHFSKKVCVDKLESLLRA